MRHKSESPPFDFCLQLCILYNFRKKGSFKAYVDDQTILLNSNFQQVTEKQFTNAGFIIYGVIIYEFRLKKSTRI